ncbi:IPT/TIG domain protein [Bacillus sp. Cr_A10]|uniref:PKD domain-containing protein n=1 Tax=Bacillus sp. Cr_A10 TaxID=3033993 RepID=UPI0023DBB803|nr:IPT/TIG domain protein [Bacillus sp. Cr_A10]MDF2066999.1 IPT/TIG domain protein [Bacillus sp. Cr_A10]
MEVGPINAFDGFPIWYKDENGLRFQLNVDPTDPFSGITPADLPDPSQPVSFPNNYPGEAFYMQAEAEMTTGTGERARLVLALEAAFVNEVPRDDEQVVFGRVRIRVAGLQPNIEYTVTHPYGVDTFIAEPDGEGFGEINFTEDIGGLNGGEFHLALNSRVHPFLQWDPSVAPSAPEGYIGNPAVLHPIVGSLFTDRFGQPQNYFRIEGPGIGIGSPDRSTTLGINGDNCIETNNFTLLGKISTISGVDVTRATYTQNESLGGLLDVFATSDDTAQTINVTGTSFNSTLLQGSDGQYFTRLRYTGARPPSTITVTNLSDNPNSIKEVVPVDFITASANYDTDTQDLIITATSSDSIGAPILSIADFGLGEIIIPSDGISTTNLTFAPAVVTINSTAGGISSIPVSVTGSPDGPIPVASNAGEDETVIFGSTVTLNGSNSTGVITSFSWTQLSGTPITLTGSNTPTPTFIAPNSTTTLVFELTVEGEGGQSRDTVNVSVIEFAPIPIAIAGPDQTVSIGSVVTLVGNATGSVTNYQWEQISGFPVQLTNANTSTATFTFPAQSTTLSFRLTVSGPGGTSSDDIQITSFPENLTVTRAEFRTGEAEWRITGTSNVIGTEVIISIYIGNVSGGRLLSQVSVDTLGEWEYRVEGSTVQPDETRAISIQSSSGGTLNNIPLNIRN